MHDSAPPRPPEEVLVHARDQRREDELTYDPYLIVSEPVDPSEVPEVDRFFRAKRALWLRTLIATAVALTVLLAGLASAIAEGYFIPVSRELPARAP